ncbi:hypothetical protein PoB_005923100 [Plakobranchus ocellatus]|uniref:Uncharacterized protein n=1 Tax=Plakobranchus ocellatus TaxID=259542 RepID=A0AAV4CBP2_9GAST|nr:hypothetical protein PoB_005923100 [Plakobranchus ocellatus]
MFDVSPLSFIPGLTPTLRMACHLDQLANSVKNILALQIEKEEGGHMAAMAEVHVGSAPAIQATTLSSRMTVAGKLDHNDLQGTVLELTLADLQYTDEGHYLCVITVVDMTGLIRTLTMDTDVTSAEANSTTLFQAVVNLQKDLLESQQVNKELATNLTDLMVKQEAMAARLYAILHSHQSKTKVKSCENDVSNLTSKVLTAESRAANVDSTLSQMAADLSQCCQAANDSLAIVTSMSQTK